MPTGLGSGHRTERERQLALLRDGVTLCPRCRRPMDRRRQRLDLDDFPARILCELLTRLTGRAVVPVKLLAHARCNRSAGATLGNRLRAAGIVRPPSQRSGHKPKRLRPW